MGQGFELTYKKFEDLDENVFIEICKHLELSELRCLSSLNRKTRELSNLDSLRDMINRKTIQNVLQKQREFEVSMNMLINQLSGKGWEKGFSYNIRSLSNLERHVISYTRDVSYLFEFVGLSSSRFEPSESVLTSLFGTQVKSFNPHGQPERSGFGPMFKLDAPSFDDLRSVLTVLVKDFDVLRMRT